MICFSCLIALAKTSDTVLHKFRKVGSIALFVILLEMFDFLTSNTILAVGLPKTVFIMFRFVTSVLSFH